MDVLMPLDLSNAHLRETFLMLRPVLRENSEELVELPPLRIRLLLVTCVRFSSVWDLMMRLLLLFPELTPSDVHMLTDLDLVPRRPSSLMEVLPSLPMEVRPLLIPLVDLLGLRTGLFSITPTSQPSLTLLPMESFLSLPVINVCGKTMLLL